MASNSTNSGTNMEIWTVMNRLLACYEFLAVRSGQGMPGYTNVSIGNYAANLAATRTVGTSGVAFISYANLSSNSTVTGIVNAVFQSINAS